MSFVSGGSLVLKTPVDLAGTSWFHGMPQMAASGYWPSAYGAMYRQHLWVYTVVQKLARAAARLPLPVYERDEMNRPRADGHPMAALLRQPNPGLSAFDLWVWTSATFDIYGEAFWYKRRSGGRVVGLYPLHPASMMWDEDHSSWYFDNGTLRLAGVADSDLVHFRSYNPESMTRGMSPLEPLRSTLENEWHARNATSSFWQRGARPGTALVHPGNLSEGAARRLKAQWDANAAGSGNTGATVVLEEGLKPEKLTLTAVEAQYTDVRKLNREEVCGAYDVPPPVVHILDRATFSNITEQMRSMYRDTMAPRLKHFEAVLEMDLRLAEWPDDNVYAEFLMDEVLRGDFEARADAYQKATYMTIAEKRRAENLPYIAGTDRIFLNAAEVPMTAPQGSPTTPPIQHSGLPALIDAGVISPDDARRLLGIPGEAPGPPELPAPVMRSVMGRLSWQKSLSEVDPLALTDGLNGHTATVLYAMETEQASGGDVASLRERLRSLVKE